MEAERGIYCTRWNSIRIINRAPGEEEEEEENPTTFSKRSVTKPPCRVRECPRICPTVNAAIRS